MPVSTNYQLTVPPAVPNPHSNPLKPRSISPQPVDSISSAGSTNRVTISWTITGRVAHLFISMINFLRSIPYIRSFFKEIPNNKDFYNNVMTSEQKNQLKQQIYITNGSSSVFGGHDHGVGFGEYMIHHHIEHPIVRHAFKTLKIQMGL